ncbi:hypothetical protein ACHAPE_006321 [Trichoderma viride]
MANILLTGASGYLGGSILAQLHNSGDGGIDLPAHGTIYALVRSDAQAQAVQDYGAKPAAFDPGNEAAIESFIMDHKVSIVIWFLDVVNVDRQILFIRALAKLRQQTGQDVHFLQAVGTNNTIIDLAEELGVKSYIIAPCIVYGKGLGFGNQISAQIVAIVRAAKEAKRVYRVDDHSPTWPVCHIRDNTDLYIHLLAAILSESRNPGHGKQGYYLPSPGSIAWDDLYSRMAAALAKKGIVEDERITLADDEALEAMDRGLKCPKAFVRVQLAGKCTLTPKNGEESLGWVPTFTPEHILETAEAEVELILKHI